MRFSFLSGGALPLDFLNTVSWHIGPNPVDHLETYADLVDWAAQAGLVGEETAAALRAQDAPEVLAAAVELREALFRLIRRKIASAADAEPVRANGGEPVRPDGGQAGPPPADTDLEVVNVRLREAFHHLVLSADGWTWDDDGDPGRVLWPVVRQAAELLAAPDAARMSICQADACGWVFLDPRHRRRWCSMEGCGNRAKAARHYERRKRESFT